MTRVPETLAGYVRCRHGQWRLRVAPECCERLPRLVALAEKPPLYTSRHAATRRGHIEGVGDVYVKTYPLNGWRSVLRAALRRGRAASALRATAALGALGLSGPAVLAAGTRWRGGLPREELLATAAVGAPDIPAYLASLASLPGADSRRRRRQLCCSLGREIARLHAAGFVHGDLVPENVLVLDGPGGLRLAYLDNDRTRRVRWLPGRSARNLVQLGRSVLPGITVTDRLRVLRAYAQERGLRRAEWRRLARRLAAKTVKRRVATDRIPWDVAARAGFRELMRSGGPFDPRLWNRGGEGGLGASSGAARAPGGGLG